MDTERITNIIMRFKPTGFPDDGHTRWSSLLLMRRVIWHIMWMAIINHNFLYTIGHNFRVYIFKTDFSPQSVHFKLSDPQWWL